MSRSVGCYFLANDPYCHWLRGLLESIPNAMRESLPLHVIPFDNRNQQVRQLCDEFSMQFIEDAAFNEWADALLLHYEQSRVKPRQVSADIRVGYLRKLYSVFSGAYDLNMFLDADILVLKDFRALFDNASTGFTFFSHTDVNDAYSESFQSHPTWCRIRHQLPEYSYNTGGFITTPQAMQPSHIEDAVRYLLSLPGAGICLDQPIINAAVLLNHSIRHCCNYAAHWFGSPQPPQDFHYFTHSAGLDKR